MNARQLYEEATALAGQMENGGEPWPRWEDLEPQQRMNWEALAVEQTRKAIEDHEQERTDAEEDDRARREVPYA